MTSQIYLSAATNSKKKTICATIKTTKRFSSRISEFLLAIIFLVPLEFLCRSFECHLQTPERLSVLLGRRYKNLSLRHLFFSGNRRVRGHVA